MWKTLGTEGYFIQPCGKLPDGKRGCSTELITVLNPDQEILLVQGDATPADIYIRFFKEKNGAWKFSGVQGAEIHNHPRRHEVDRSTGTPLLRIASQGVRGSGVDSEIENWFDLTQAAFKPVFSFIVNGSERRLDFGIGRQVFAYLDSGKDFIDVTLEVHFIGFDGQGEHDLGIASYSARYIKKADTKTFYLAEMSPKSEVSKAEFVALADMDEGPSNEELIRLDMYGLTAVANGKDNSAKSWLKELLNRCKETPEVLKLKALLH